MFKIKNLSMIYDMDTEEKMYALNGVDLSLSDTGLVGIIGPSGSGKSTLMYCLSTLKIPTEGSIPHRTILSETSIFPEKTVLVSCTSQGVEDYLDFVELVKADKNQKYTERSGWGIVRVSGQVDKKWYNYIF